jgi:hypothetical protein
MACGTPVLAFNTGGVGDLVVKGETGELIPSGDVARFAATMVILLADPKRLSWLGMNSREKVLRQFSEGAVGPALRELYERLSGLRPELAPDGDPVPEETAFENAAQTAIRAAMAKGYRSLEQESASLKEHLAKADEEIRLLRRYFEESQSQGLQLRGALEQERAALEQERRKTLWRRLKEKFPPFR